jgi:hypothetical protein
MCHRHKHLDPTLPSSFTHIKNNGYYYTYLYFNPMIEVEIDRKCSMQGGGTNNHTTFILET